MAHFHPDLTAARFIPSFSFGPRITALANRAPVRPGQGPDDLIVEDLLIPGPMDAPDIDIRVYRPRDAVGSTPALLWVHGGGMITGNRLSDERTNAAFVRSLGITVVSVEYRLAPAHPAPAAVEDVYATFRWLVDHAREQRIDGSRIALGGASAGAGLAAATALMALDSGGSQPAFQLLIYPMLDDRTVVRGDHQVRGVRVWTKGSNRYAWSAYLGHPPGGENVLDYAAPARRADLRGLPPAWIGVGSNDLFHDEDVRYAERLREAGVPCELVVVDGAFHGFDILMSGRPVSQSFWRAQEAALRKAFGVDSPADAAAGDDTRERPTPE
ncbi:MULTISPECIES: alpha/beta hydrolase [unclassified Microbacterium]|uniref:alpha/beta hydrolase n=1 Tax=unclassified Microbacterium TaxID=2609290 RepID=UPI000EA901A1|nr:MULTISPECIES: alpha/beta hydrolase fold domain-containing protein [unclassified Microbacterium]MBT2484645.1 alpha/beta hydrolase [Microbacterium sp. ISL-108]RKN67535.1 alpha/beta hydrolase [Microbacterium sp. CGR2]